MTVSKYLDEGPGSGISNTRTGRDGRGPPMLGVSLLIVSKFYHILMVSSCAQWQPLTTCPILLHWWNNNIIQFILPTILPSLHLFKIQNPHNIETLLCSGKQIITIDLYPPLLEDGCGFFVTRRPALHRSPVFIIRRLWLHPHIHRVLPSKILDTAFMLLCNSY